MQYGAWLLAARLPDGEPLALIAEVRHRLGAAPVVMLAGLASDPQAIPEPERHGIRGWLMKNDSRERILAAVAGALGGG